MRYMLMLHVSEQEIRDRSPEWVEEVVAFLARFDDELLVRSELEWSETLGGDTAAVVIGPGGAERAGCFSADAPLRRLWVVRVASEARARELAGTLAGELDTWIELRECLPSAQRP